ncbi:hypothetical protein L218DRAFT_1076931 [Marasmius fiardii PR-910]|nr:hypothetical protein L218DRAFT_1076931 [Marasmius fiardii PR-910]
MSEGYKDNPGFDLYNDPTLLSSMDSYLDHPGNEVQNVSEPNADISSRLPSAEKPDTVGEFTLPIDPATLKATSVNFKRLFALIIGINEYEQSEKNLGGAVLDAEKVKTFLTDKLGVPRDNIKTLFNEEATKDRILAAIKGLPNAIPNLNNDPILIYYAGHGGRARAPPDWYTSDAKNKIEMLCPHDFNFRGSNSDEGQGIFDLTLAQYLNDIARKSDNVCVILDCCHSGSATRDGELPVDFKIRGVELPSGYVIPLSVFEKQITSGTRGIGSVKDFEKIGSHSHVLLAACKKEEGAGEQSSGGFFTTELVKLFGGPRNVSDLTYLEVIKTINLEDYTLTQNPQCVGANQECLLFSTNVPSPYRALSIKISAKPAPGEFKLDAGEAYGILGGAEFNVYSDKNMTNFVGRVKAGTPRQYDAPCHVADGIQFPTDFQTGFALQTHTGFGRDIRLFVPHDETFSRLLNALKEHMQYRDKMQTFCLLDSENPPEGDPADLALRVVDKNGQSFVHFDVKNQKCVEMGLTTMPYAVSLSLDKFLMAILRNAADFYWKFRDYKPKLSSLDVTLECFELENDPNREDFYRPKDDRNNLVNSDGTIVIDSVDRKPEESDDPVPYGYRINNRSTENLYAALFYFDFSDLSITSHYEPDSAHSGAPGTVDFSIPPKKSVTVGFGDSGTNPIGWSMRSEKKIDEGVFRIKQDVDVGFLKLYVATHRTEYRDIAQKSPIDGPDRGGAPFGARRPRILLDTLIVPVVLKRGE